MTPERWQQVKEIFNSAIRYRPAERSVFLSEACSGDDALRVEVESLIKSAEKTGSFIDNPAYEEAADLLVNTKSDLPPGQVIGSYQILSFINRGGMGEVYLAQDMRLRRRVALKLLPTTYTRDSDRLRRFEQEARAASALNHPNIITIYEIAEVDSTHFIATEFVEGETLRQRLSYARLNLTESLNIAIQIADALAAAHKAGIVHRDIKPENVMLRPDGYVKVLDFGLAKLSEQAPDNVSAEAPTRQVKTGSGVVIGTAGYMSPEQARGKNVDDRSDIFSLGALIYEMVAHKKPFEGDTPSDIMASILKTDPPPLSRVVANAPPELVRIVTKALRKDREERYQVVRELLIDLRTLKQELEFQAKLGNASSPDETHEPLTSFNQPVSTLSPVSNAGSAITNITQSLSIEIKRHKFATALILVTMALVISALGVAVYRIANPKMRYAPFWDIKLTRITNSGNAIDAIISPDGKYIVYALSDRSQQSLWIRQVSNANDRQILPPAAVGFFGLTFSRDGTEVFYAIKANQDSGTLYRIPVLGGTPVKILDHIDGPISFSPDGKRFVLIRGNYPQAGESALVIANADGSEEHVLSVKKLPERFAPVFFTGPSWSSDGKLIAASYSVRGGGGSVAVYGVDDGKEQVLAAQGWPFTSRVEWLPDMSGILVVAGDSTAVANVWLVGYPDGTKRRITNDLSTYRALTITANATKFTTVEANGLVNVWVVPENDVTRAVKLPTGNVGFYASAGNNLSWTPDNRIVYVTNEAGLPDIWVMDPNGGNRKQLTTNKRINVSPSVSADGHYVVFASTNNGRKNIWRMDIDGNNQIQLTKGLEDSYPVISPDGKWVVYSSLDSAKPTVWKVPLQGGEASQVFSQIAAAPSFSPDGKYLVYLYPEAPDPYAPPNRIAIAEFPGGNVIKTFAFQTGGTVPTVVRWSADGKSIFYTLNLSNVSNIWQQSVAGGAPKQVTDFKDSLITGFAFSRDGKQMSCTRGTLVRDAILIEDVKK